MKYFVVIDTNVLVSAVLKYNSIPGTIIEFAFNGKIIPVLNKVDLPNARTEEVKKEIEDVIGIPAMDAPCVSAKTGLNI